MAPGTWRSSPLPSLTERDTRSPSSGPDTPRSAAPVGLDGMYTGAGPSYAGNHTALADLGIPPMVQSREHPWSSAPWTGAVRAGVSL
ncbi:hypothetical protein PENSPDRAFT_658168 [Peniophora sp. CONT]|nr:hypothetical protein PENSPDRAFT_658168 [Peniophora sp. CONT]